MKVCDNMEIKITDHAYDRRKRMGLSKKAFYRIATKAYELGIKHKDAHGRLKKYYDKLFLSHKNANNIRTYGEFLYIFHDNLLITVWDLDNHLKRLLR